MAWNIADLIEHVSDRVPDRVAIIVGDDSRTYREMEENANRLAHHLLAQGVGPGDHVGIYAFNSHEFVETILAAYKIRAVPINVNYRYVESELEYLYDNARAAAALVESTFLPRVAPLRARPKILLAVGGEHDEFAAALAEARKNLDNPPKIATEIALQQIDGNGAGQPRFTLRQLQLFVSACDSGSLTQAAAAHSDDMVSHNFFSHTGSNGSTAGSRVTAAGYVWRSVGENIAAGQGSVAEVVDGWMKSDGHCANLMNPAYTEMGLAYGVDAKSEMGIYWGQVFATPR